MHWYRLQIKWYLKKPVTSDTQIAVKRTGAISQNVDSEGFCLW
jgi:hypothetical protein